jgi:hypothetical protein
LEGVSCVLASARLPLDLSLQAHPKHNSLSLQADTTEESIRIRCEHQLAAYELVQAMKMKNNNGK